MQYDEYSVNPGFGAQRAAWLAEVESALGEAEQAAALLSHEQEWFAAATALLQRIGEVRAAIAPLKAVNLASIDPEWIELSRWFHP